jgi:predicted N-acetyltransferase YhbS
MATRAARSVARSSSTSLLSRPTPSALTVPPAALTVFPPAPSVSASPSARPRLRLATARTGDHPSIHGLLTSVFHGPSAREFQSQLDEPGYEPADRLIVKDGEEIAAHLRLARQTIHVGPALLPVARFMDLATAPAFRSRGLATALLAAGERAAAERGLLIGLTRTGAPSLFARQGWSVCGRHVFSTASPRAVLAELAASAAAAALENQSTASLLYAPPQPIIVRPLRRIELPAIVRLYEQSGSQRAGSPVRSEEYWEWLLARGACDRIYVAATEVETTDFAKLQVSIVGYACVRQSRIVELVAAAGRDDVARQLAERVCADAREQDGWTVRCDAPPCDPLHNLFRRAGGRLTVNQELGGELFMAKLLDPLAFLRSLVDVFAERSAAAELTRPSELGVELRSGIRKATGPSGVIERFRVTLSSRGAKIETGGPSRHSIALAYHDFAPLLLGDVGAEAMRQLGRLGATTATARNLANVLFPSGCWWRPPLDDLLA